jgi:hypothetical protein
MIAMGSDIAIQLKCSLRVGLLLVMGTFGTACDGTGDHGAVRSDSAGVTVVVNTASDRPLAWSLTQRLKLGGDDDGPQAFYQVSRPLVSFDDQGGLYVLNRQASQVVKFSADGEFEFAVGSEGGGPGEFLRPRGVAAAADGGFLVFDSGKDRFVTFGRDGTADTEIVAEGAMPQFLARDTFLLTHHYRYSRTGYREHLQLTDGSDTLLVARTEAEVRSFRYESCGTLIGSMAPVIFAPELVWHGHKGGSAVNSEPGYVVNVYDAGGNLLRSVRRSDRARHATPSLAESWAEANPVRFGSSTGECIVRTDEVVEKRGYAEYMPWISDVALAPDGTLWVQRYALAPHSSYIDVFDATGAYVGTLRPDFPFPLGFLPNGDLLLSERDDLDVERLVVALLVIDE